MARIVLVSALCGLLGAACNSEQGRNEQRTIHDEDAPTARRVVRQDINAVTSGVAQAARVLRRGFQVEDPAQQERELRGMLRRLQQPQSRHAIPGLMATPITFVAAVGLDGNVICRDAENDLMRGFAIGEAAPVVRRAIAGEAGRELSRLPSLEEGELPSVTLIFAAPAVIDDEVVGVIAAGLPLWRVAQQISRQLQLEHSDARERGHQMWAMMYDDEQELHYHGGFPDTLIDLAPDAPARSRGLSGSPGGYTGEFQQFGRWYGYGIVPIQSIHDDVGVILFRSEP
ncbi:MAG: hypothetical protein AB8I08_28520 [Sandaracinaceae bacterium]